MSLRRPTAQSVAQARYGLWAPGAHPSGVIGECTSAIGPEPTQPDRQENWTILAVLAKAPLGTVYNSSILLSERFANALLQSLSQRDLIDHKECSLCPDPTSPSSPPVCALAVARSYGSPEAHHSAKPHLAIVICRLCFKRAARPRSGNFTFPSCVKCKLPYPTMRSLIPQKPKFARHPSIGRAGICGVSLHYLPHRSFGTSLSSRP